MNRRAWATALCAIAELASAAAVAAPGVPAWSLLPQPVMARPAASGAFRIADGAVVAVRGIERAQTQAVVDQFLQRVATVRGLNLHAQGAAPPAIVFEVDPQARVVGAAGYRIAIGRQGIVVSARTARGAYYGSVTLWQLLTPPGWVRGSAAEVADGTIEDHPRFAWRALLLDSGRHFQSVADIEHLIDWMSLDKLDVLLWHLTEDQGWRLDVPKYPELVAIGACRKATGLDAELTGSPATPYCGHYSEADVREVVRYAAAHYVAVVPGIDLPGHSQAAVAAYPWLGVTGARPPVWTDWGVSPWLLDPDAKTLRFVDDVLDEVMKLFPSKYISIGGDEADKQQWNASPRVRAQMHRLGLATMDQLQGWFTRQVAGHLAKHGRTPVGWDDELVAGAALPASEVVMSWHGNDHEHVALTALQQGHDVVMTPQESLYFDHYQSALPDEWPGPPPMATLHDVYDTAVIPPGANAAEAAHVIGVQAGLWTELMPTFARDQHAVFPRIAALAELGWSPAGAHDWSGFPQRLPAELARYRALGIGYADTAFAPAFALSAGAGGTLQVALATQTGVGTIRYTTDGSAPTPASTAYAGPLTFSATRPTTLRAATFAADGFELAAPRTRQLGADSLSSRDGSALESCSRQPGMRLGGRGTTRNAQPVYRADVGDMCWLWPHAPLAGARRVDMTVERLPWRFGDEARDAVVRPAASAAGAAGAAGEIVIHADSCTGPLLASLPLAAAARATGQVELHAALAMPPETTPRDLCIVATGDPRKGQWALARVAFSH